MSEMSIRAVIFDMDGILIDSENTWQENEKALFGEYGVDLTDELLVQTRGLRTQEMVEHWTSRFQVDTVSRQELMDTYDSRMVETMRTRVPLMEGAEVQRDYGVDTELGRLGLDIVEGFGSQVESIGAMIAGVPGAAVGQAAMWAINPGAQLRHQVVSIMLLTMTAS